MLIACAPPQRRVHLTSLCPPSTHKWLYSDGRLVVNTDHYSENDLAVLASFAKKAGGLKSIHVSFGEASAVAESRGMCRTLCWEGGQSCVCSPGSPRLPLAASKRKASRLGADGPAVKNKSALSRLCSTIIAIMSSSADLESLQMIGLQLSPESAGRVAKVRALLGLIDFLAATNTHATTLSPTLSFHRPWPVAPSWGA